MNLHPNHIANRSPSRRGLVLAALALGAVLAVCWAIRQQQLAERRTRALERGAAWLHQPNDSHSTALVWLAARAAEREPRAALVELARTMKQNAISDPLSALIGQEPAQLSLVADDTPEGEMHPIDRLVTSVARCAADAKAAERVWAFLEEEHAGYLLTHQVLFSLWAEELGCTLPSPVHTRREVLLSRIRTEAEQNPIYSDLFVEQLAVLELAGRGQWVEASWLQTLVAHQSRDGSWQSPVERSTLSYKGVTIEQVLDPVHVTALAISALAHAS